MRFATAVLAVATLAAVASPPAHGALNGDYGFSARAHFLAGLDQPENMTFLSGRLEATMPEARGSWGLFNTTGLVINGLQQVCWQVEFGGCASGDLSVVVSRGGSVGLQVPDAVSATATAAHALVLPVDFGGQADLEGLDLGPSLVALGVAGEVSLDLPAIPATAPVLMTSSTAAALVALDDTTILTVSEGGLPLHDSAGEATPWLLQGAPSMGTVGTDLMVVPFGSGSRLEMGPADAEAADRGLDVRRLNDLLGQLDAAGAGSRSAQGSQAVGQLDFGFLQPVVTRILNGAFVDTPLPREGAGFPLASMRLVRFSHLTAVPAGPELAVEGAGPLDVDQGRVAHAPALLGVGWVQLPWWSYLLWALAIAAFVVRIVLRSPKRNERWDRLRWVGWIARPVAWVLFWLLWDNEVHAVWGVSLLSGGASGEQLIPILALEVLPLGLVYLGAVTPLRILFRSSLRIAGQGRFMGLSAPAATLLGFLLGATLMLSFVDLIIQQVGS